MRKKRATDPADASDCYVVALRLLGFRWRSIAETQSALAERGFEPDAVSGVVERLIAERWLDDARFAEELTRAKLKKEIGRLRIARELSAHGIDRDAQDEALAAATRDIPEEEGLAAAIAKKERSLASRYGAEYPSTEVGREKIMAHMLSRGFETSAILAAMRRQR
jgi:regulatory protein